MNCCERIRHTLQVRRPGSGGEVVFFVNVGDPSLQLSFELLRVLAARGARIVELCVPFPRSPSDGPVLQESHRRALQAGVDLKQALAFARRACVELGLQLILLSDFEHSVEPVGLPRFLSLAADAGVCGTLIHALPARLRRAYLEESARIELGTVMTCFLSSDERTRRSAYRESSCFAYIVSRFGRSGGPAARLGDLLPQVRALRAETTCPLALGFGIKSTTDVASVHATGVEAAIVGSAATQAFAAELPSPARMLRAFDDFAGALLLGAGASPATALVSP